MLHGNPLGLSIHWKISEFLERTVPVYQVANSNMVGGLEHGSI